MQTGGTVLFDNFDEKSYDIDYDKIKTVEECVELIKIILCGTNFNGRVPTITIYSSSPMYEKLKHLAKE